MSLFKVKNIRFHPLHDSCFTVTSFTWVIIPRGRDAIVLRENIQGIVVGLPLLPSGDEGYSVEVARKLGSKLEIDLKIAVYYEDETLTTEAVLSREPNINKKPKRRNDDLAATLILDQFLQKRRIDNIQIDAGDKKC